MKSKAQLLMEVPEKIVNLSVSEGYTGDVWAGAAEDAAFSLEAVKKRYKKDEDSRTLAIVISRGATVGLTLSELKNKINHTIVISTHTDFLKEDVTITSGLAATLPVLFYAS
jgi:hypothetical protein